jgi:4-hydroxy-3-polyprenylbenzoate decarboxylase
MRGREERSFPGAVGCSGLLIDATRKGPFPPVGLPKKSYMESALKIWQQEELPNLNLKTPWYGYPLGLWDDEDDRLAELVVRGEYFQSKQTKGH